MTFTAALQDRCQVSGDAPFMLFRGETISWARLGDVVARVATLLHEREVVPGNRVLLACENTPTFCYLWFGLRWLGATSVPLHTKATPDHVRRVMADAEIGLVVGDGRSIRRLCDSGIAIDEDAAVTFETHADLEYVVSRLPKRRAHPAAPSAENSLVYTSGTTGPPKGAIIPDQALVVGGAELAEAIGIRSADRILVTLPLFHTNPQVYAVMTAIATGCSLALLDRFEPDQFLEQAVRYQATGFTYVGTMLTILAERLPGLIPNHALRFCTGGGATTKAWTEIEHQLGVTVHELYGMTETGGWVTANRHDAWRHGTCGTTRPDMECAILDGNDNSVQPDIPGEICIRCRKPAVMFAGYYRQPEITLGKCRNLWFHTGDLGSMDTDGYLTFLGRMDDMIRRKGENINPDDVEAVLTSHPAIAEAAVVGVPDDKLGQEIKAVIVQHQDQELGDLDQFFDGKLPRFAWPRLLSLRDALPKTDTHKVQTTQLKKHENEDIDLRTEWATTADPAAEEITTTGD